MELESNIKKQFLLESKGLAKEMCVLLNAAGYLGVTIIVDKSGELKVSSFY